LTGRDLTACSRSAAAGFLLAARGKTRDIFLSLPKGDDFAMSNAATDHAASVAAKPEGGFDFGQATNGKVGMWIFLLTDAMSFGGLLLAYAILRAGSHDWPDPSKRLGIPFTAAMTFDLICSSVTMVLALAAAQEKNKKGLLFWLGLTILGGLLFLGGQAKEYTSLISEGAGISVDLMWSTFFIPTSFHGLHVFTGVTYLTVIWFHALRGKYTDGPNASANHVEIAGLFWHFVDLVWILVFTFIYLI
jgi:heme/copper-type cytochrome/quinol oxidase subunit 3